MSHESILIPSVSDNTILDCFIRICKKNPTAAIHCSLFGSISIDKVTSQNLNESGIPDEYKYLIDNRRNLINSLTLNVSGFQVTFYRRGHPNKPLSNPLLNEIIIPVNNSNTASSQIKIQVVSDLNDSLNFTDLNDNLSNSDSPESDIKAIHHQVLSRLESLNIELISKSQDFREDLEKSYIEKVEQNQNTLEQQKKKLVSETEEKIAATEEARRLFEDKLKAIDDRSNTHLRREIRDSMLSDVKNRAENFGVSDRTSAKRNPVRVGIFFLCLLLALLLAFTSYELIKLEDRPNWSSISTTISSTASQDSIKAISELAQLNESNKNTKIYWVWLKITLLSFALVATILYYIKWQVRWAEQHSRSELDLQQFHLDINRANWAIESCLEWHKETGLNMPNELLTSITRNLFKADTASPDEVIHPADELASALLGSASKVKLNVAGNEITYDKPSKINNNTISSSKDT